MFKLMSITVSTRNGRKGDVLAGWIESLARQDPDWEVVPVDLKALNLPMLDEPEHPRLGQYQYAHTKAWSAMVAAADAFIAVTPEYNFSAPPSLINALDYLSREWQYKPMGFVSYGGIAGGTRSVQMTKQVVTSLKIVPMVESVGIPSFTQHIDAERKFTPTAQIENSAAAMLGELKKWTGPLKAMRE